MTLYSEEIARALIERCEEIVQQSSLSTKEKNGAKALLLRDLIAVSVVDEKIVGKEKLKQMYSELTKAEKLSRATKKVLATLKPLIQV